MAFAAAGAHAFVARGGGGLRRRAAAARRVQVGRARVAMVAAPAGGGGSGSRVRDVGRLVRLFGRVATPYLRRNVRARWDAGAVAGFTLMNNGVSVLISFISKDFWTALNTKDAGLFYHQAGLFFGVLVLCVPVVTYGGWVREMAALRWRNWMTETVMREYMTNRAFYDIDQDGALDNPDQRISADLAAFTSDSLSFLLTFATAFVDILSFSAILWSISPVLFGVLIGYAASGTAVTLLVGRNFVSLNRRQLQLEADFRYALMRLRENAESVAFFAGERRERRLLELRLARAVDNATTLIGWQRNLGFVQTGYRYAVQILPALVVSPRYFSGAIPLGSVTQSFGAFSHVFNDLSIVVTRFDALSQLGAQLGRIQELCAAVENNVARDDRVFTAADAPEALRAAAAHSERADGRADDAGITLVEGADGGLALDGVSVVTPGGGGVRRELVSGVSVAIPPAGRLLIAGPSGVGKSSLIRAVAGLWTSGAGVITRPPSDRIFFLPQRPFCTLGTLAENLVYPKSFDDPDVPTDAELLKILARVDLGDLADRVDGGLYAECDWGDVLSLGEQQRLSFARLLVSKPALAVIDEGSSALDILGEKKMYSMLREMEITVVSIGHRPTLIKYHDTILRLRTDQDGDKHFPRWSLEPIEEHQRERIVAQAL